MEQPFDDTTKTFYRHYFEERNIWAIAQYEVFARSRAIDLLVECTDEDLLKLQATIFAHFRRINALEFKGIHDPLTAVDLNVIIMRAWGVGVVEKTEQKNEASEPVAPRLTAREIAEMPTQRTVTIICVTRPDKILETLYAEYHFASTGEPGIYGNNGRELPIWIIHPTELELKPANYVLLSLARGKKLEQFIELCMAQGLTSYLQLALDMGLVSEPNVVWRKIWEAYSMEIEINEETWRYIDDFFLKTPESLQKLPTLRRMHTEMMHEAVENAEKEAEERGKKPGEKHGKERGAVEGRQATLLHVLRHKFGELPTSVIQRIEATKNVARLERWLDQALDAETVTAIDFQK